MDMPRGLLRQLIGELDNFKNITRRLLPQPEEVPRFEGIDVFGSSRWLNSVAGGDLIIYLDFKQRFDLNARVEHAESNGRSQVARNLTRCQKTAGIAILDVAGHRVTDASLAAMLHQALLVGATYELDMFGEITRRLFENLNTAFCRSSDEHKFIAMTYGEISEDGRFWFLSAAQPFPLIFSHQFDRFMDVSEDQRVSFPPLGLLPSLDTIDRSATTSHLGFKDQYAMNHWALMGAGDILVLQTDGLAEHHNGREAYVPDRLEEKLREVKHLSAKEIFDAIMSDLIAFSDPKDDITLVIIKRR